MLKTPEDFCRYVAGCVRIYRQAMPKLLEYKVYIPLEYLNNIECFTSNMGEFIKKVDEYMPTLGTFANFISFEFVPGVGGLAAKITHTEEAPITSWPFTASTYLIDKLLVFHRETVGPHVIVRISQDNLLGSETIMETYRTFRARFGDDLEFRINKDYFEARMF